MRYQVSIIGKMTIVADTESAFRMVAMEKELTTLQPETAYGLGTLYQIKGGFVPTKVFSFTIVDIFEQSAREGDVNELKAAMDFFFLTLLSTELYVKEVPRASSLFSQEAARIYGIKLIAA